MDAAKLQLLNKTIAEKAMNWTQEEGVIYRDAEGNVQYLAPWSESLPHAIDLANRFNIGSIPDSVPGTYKAFEVSLISQTEIAFVAGSVSSSDSLPVALCLSALKANSVDTAQFE